MIEIKKNNLVAFESVEQVTGDGVPHQEGRVGDGRHQELVLGRPGSHGHSLNVNFNC